LHFQCIVYAGWNQALVVPSTSGEVYSIKAASLEGTDQVDEALVAWEAIESAATQTVEQIQQGRVTGGDGESTAAKTARMHSIQWEASQHKKKLLKGQVQAKTNP
jgi:hypothetical protein